MAANFTELRTKLKQYLDDVEKNNETLIIKEDQEVELCHQPSVIGN